MDTLAEYGRPILSLLVVFSLLGFTVWKLGRHRGRLSLGKLFGKTFLEKTFGSKRRSPERMLETVERLVLTPQHTLHVVRFREREILVVTHPHGCDRLDQETNAEGLPGLAARGAGA
jgi:hypothetical protein